MTDLTNNQALKQKLADAGVKYAIASYVDIHGISKGKFVPVAHLGQMMEGSELYTGAALDGVPQDISDDEVAAMPDADGVAICPWNRQLAWFPGNLYLNGAPFEACSRHPPSPTGCGCRHGLSLQPGYRDRVFPVT